MFNSVRRFFNKQEQAQEPTLRELCDAVAAHPDSVIVAVFERSDFLPGDAETLDHDQLREDIYNLVMGSVVAPF